MTSQAVTLDDLLVLVTEQSVDVEVSYRLNRPIGFFERFQLDWMFKLNGLRGVSVDHTHASIGILKITKYI